MSDYQNEQRPPEDISGTEDGMPDQAWPNNEYTPPECDMGNNQGYQPTQGYQPPPSWDNLNYRQDESSTAGKVFKVIGIIFLIIAAVIAFAVVGCFALIFFSW